MRILLPPGRPCPLADIPRIAFAAISQIAQGDKRFLLPELWSLLVFDYDMEAELDGVPCRIVPGCLALLAPGTLKLYRHRRERQTHLVIHFTTPGTAGGRPIPRLLDLGARRPGIEGGLASVVALHRTDPLHAAVRLWDLLLELADLQPALEPARPPAVTEALRLIAAARGRPPGLAALARRIGLSPGHLCTAFRRCLGCGPATYARRLRLEHARHLLEHSTLPVREIAAEVGLPDLQHFNKLVRRAFGRPPRTLRREAGGRWG